MPAYNETLGLVGSGGKYTTKWQTDQGLDMDQEFEALRAEIQAIWDKQQRSTRRRAGDPVTVALRPPRRAGSSR